MWNVDIDKDDTEYIDCPDCDGTGIKNGIVCHHCDNTGWVYDPSDGGTMTCPRCDGESGQPCENEDCDNGQIYSELG